MKFKKIMNNIYFIKKLLLMMMILGIMTGGLKDSSYDND